MTRLCLTALLLAAQLFAAPAARAGETPVATVERLNVALLESMKNADELGYRGRYEALAPVLRETFAFPAMARVGLGVNWNGVRDAPQQAFISAFTEPKSAV